MRSLVILMAALTWISVCGRGQIRPGGKLRQLEPCSCPVKLDSSLRVRCAYMIVPEIRKKDNGKFIKLPFVLVESRDPQKRKDPLLYTAGGPGGSSLDWTVGISRHNLFPDRDYIAFEQRGTQYAVPNLWIDDLSEAIKESYLKNLNKDSMVLVGVRRCKKKLEARGIDLSGYNTDESVDDMDDLLVTLKIDSVNLTGGSYSGGLMLALLQKDPARIRSLVLNSPLPTFVRIDEEEPVNFNEALDILFGHIQKDSTDQVLYGRLKERFRQYFTSIGGKTFTIRYRDSLSIQYARNDLLQIIEDAFGSASGLKDIAALTFAISSKVAFR